MKLQRVAFVLIAGVAFVHAAAAAVIDMDDPRRALGRVDDVRVDAQLVTDTVSPGSPIGITYQIQNFTSYPVAVAHRVADASYDADSGTITVTIGAEVPPAGDMPQLITIAPGEKKVLRTAATPALNLGAIRTALARIPRYVQLKVAIVRDLVPFRSLMEAQATRPQPLPDELFDAWFESTDTILLNKLPVHFSTSGRGTVSADRRHASYGGH